jgi:hypothetical protein
MTEAKTMSKSIGKQIHKSYPEIDKSVIIKFYTWEV